MKRYLALLTAILLLLALVGCAEQPQEEIREKILKNITEVELIKLQALAISFEHPEGGDVSLSEVKDSQWNPVLEIMSQDEATGTYTLKVDPRLAYGFCYFVVTKDELNSIQAWEKEQGKQIIYPLNNPSTKLGRFYDADYWYLVSENGMPMDENGNEIPYSEDMILIPDYYYDKSGNVRYQLEMAGETYRIRVCVYTYFEFRVGRELTFPLKDLNEEMLLNVK